MSSLSRDWRKATEARSEKLASKVQYAGQAPPSRCIGLWGACSSDGFAEVLISKKRKVCGAEWAKATDAGKLERALLALNPMQDEGPWSVLCDNESFLRSRPAQAAHRRARVVLWKMPPRSPELNPIEKYWSWLRRSILRKDLQDLCLGKMCLAAQHTLRASGPSTSRRRRRPWLRGAPRGCGRCVVSL